LAKYKIAIRISGSRCGVSVSPDGSEVDYPGRNRGTSGAGRALRRANGGVLEFGAQCRARR